MIPSGSRFWIACLALATLARAEQPLPNVERLKSSPVLQHLRPNPMPQAPRTEPEKTVAQMYVPPGFRAELVIGEPDLHQPVAFAWDERGRLWVAEAYSYPTKRPAGQGLDKLVIFEDPKGDGTFKTRKVFAEGLNLVSGFEVGHGGVYVGAAPELLFIPDRNHDDVPDGPPQVLLDGFGYQDTHECLNSFLWGPDGWLYGIQGVFNLAHIGKPGATDAERTELRAGVWRYHPAKRKFEVFVSGGSNPWGLDYDEHGQMFMTHCRSYWGRGGTTHVIQGGNFWNQANANYAPFIIANPPADFPEFRNFLLASARYDSGAGGAGAPGSDAIYGGHAHVGTMIYLGDNWPDEYRGHLFTHNLHGHQINQQINLREGSGFNTVHAGRDQFFCSDPMYVAVDLQYGPDGAVYFIDWYDQQHCHNPNTERWDRTNGRMYRMEWEATYKPVKVNLATMTDRELVAQLHHKNQWFVRTAQRLLSERAEEKRTLDPAAITAVQKDFSTNQNPVQRLSALWTLHAMQKLSNAELGKALTDHDEYIRAWGIQLAVENPGTSAPLLRQLSSLAKKDSSALVRLYLASAVQRLPEATAWEVIENLAQRAEDRDDRNLPRLLWQGLAQRMPNHLDRAFRLAKNCAMPLLAEYINWYAASLEGNGLNRVIADLSNTEGEALRRRLAGLWLAVENRGHLAQPAAWNEAAPQLYASKDPRVQHQAEQLAAVFGDQSMFPRLRELFGNATAPAADRKHAFSVLSRAQDAGALSVFLSLLDDSAFRTATIPLLARFDSPAVAQSLLNHFESFSTPERAAALSALTGRPSFALALLDAIDAKKLPRTQVTAFHIRQLSELKHAEVDRRVTATWGQYKQSAGEKQQVITKLEKAFNEAPLWAYDAKAGRQTFQKLCAQCHVFGPDGTRVGPELTGAGRNGIRYFLENIVDPNAVIGTDFQLTTVETKDGTVISGLIQNETPGSLTIRTISEQVNVAKTDITRRATSDTSLMPEGLLEALSDRERLELLKYLMQ